MQNEDLQNSANTAHVCILKNEREKKKQEGKPLHQTSRPTVSPGPSGLRKLFVSRLRRRSHDGEGGGRGQQSYQS